MPDIIYILLDGSVRGEFTTACSVQKRHLRPLLLILVSCLHSLLSLSIGSEVSENEVLVCSGAVLSIQKRIIDISEQLCIAGEGSIDQLHPVSYTHLS